MRTISLLVLGSLLPGTLGGQTTTAGNRFPVMAGAKVRITAPAMAPEAITGKVAATGVDALVLEPASGGGAYRSVPLSDIEALEVYRGNAGARMGGIVGGVIGAGAGYLIASSLAKKDECTDGLACLDRLGEEMVGSVLLAAGAICGGTLVGWALGTGIGNALGSDIWEPIPTDRLRVGIAPRVAGGITVGISVAF